MPSTGARAITRCQLGLPVFRIQIRSQQAHTKQHKTAQSWNKHYLHHIIHLVNDLHFYAAVAQIGTCMQRIKRLLQWERVADKRLKIKNAAS